MTVWCHVRRGRDSDHAVARVWVFAGPGAAWLAYALIEFARPRWPWLDNLDAELRRWFAATISASLAISTWAVFSAGTHTFPEADWFVWAEKISYVATTAFGLATLIQGRDIRGTERVSAGRIALVVRQCGPRLHTGLDQLRAHGYHPLGGVGIARSGTF